VILFFRKEHMATGKKTGGRQRGTPNRATAEMRAEMVASGELPLDYMLRIMRSKTADPPRRDAMARSAAQYCHPQLQAVAHKLVDEKGNPLAPVVNLTVSTPKLEDKTPRLTCWCGFSASALLGRRSGSTSSTAASA
jgi:hypothetical protein